MTWTSLIALIYWLIQRQKVGITSPLFVLGVLSALYFGLGGFLFGTIRDLSDPVEVRISIYVLVINIAIILGHRYSKKDVASKFFQPKTPKVIWILILAPCLLVYPLWIIKGGGLSYFSLNRTEKFSIYSQSTFFVFIETIIYFIHAVLVMRKGKINGLTVFLLLWAIVHASRHGILMSLAPSGYKYFKKLKTGRALVFALLGGSLLFLSKSYLQTTMNISETDEIVQIGELINWKRNYYEIVSNDNRLSEMPNPAVTNFIGLISPKVPKEKVLSDWFMMEYHPKQYAKGNKYGFNAFSEYERYGGVMFMFIYWLFIVILLNKFYVNPNYIVQAMYVVLILSSYKLFRSESYNFNRFMIWYVFYIYSLSELIYRIIVKKKVT